MALELLTSIDNVLKKVIAPKLQENIFKQNAFLSHLRKNANVTDIANGTFHITAVSSGHSGVYSGGEGQQSIETGSFGTRQMQVKAKYVYGAFELSDQALEGTKSKEGALANILTLHTEQLKMAFDREFQRQFVRGNGQGILGTVGTAVTGTTITVDTTLYLQPGRKVLIGTKAEVEAGTADAVTVVDVISNTQFTVSASITVAVNDRVVSSNVYDSTNTIYRDASGLGDLLSADSTTYPTFQNISRVTNAFTKPASFDGSTTFDLTLAKMTEMYLYARKYGDPDIIVASEDQYRKYSNLLVANVRYTQPAQGGKALEGGFTGLVFAGGGGKEIPVICDFDLAPGTIHFLDTKLWTIGEMTPLSWITNQTGGILEKIPRGASYVGTMRWYGNLIGLNPRGNATMYDLKTT